MNLNRTNLVSLVLLLTTTTPFASTLTDEQITAISYTYPTPFGDLKFYNESGQLGVMSARVDLDSKPFLTPSPIPDGWGNTLQFFPLDTIKAIDAFPRAGKKIGRRLTKRLILAEAPDGNCITQFVILDFTLDKPYISKRFGENPDMKFCLIFERAKWGKSESRIVLGNGTFIYKTGGDLTPVNDE
ncbi:hypothetical protein [Duganella sp. Root1480D1]|uniref:hypothetical protein n=1 Tax=Duganella sp. Root1480D1 TaxID=1736471 RepID=UPI00070C5D35|nr:hypothetical protein [Duganella sp. Root1480D1]KQZ39527.1 hypothetical protein ASD58_03765 [Duganella sp. Root1480D1]